MLSPYAPLALEQIKSAASPDREAALSRVLADPLEPMTDVLRQWELSLADEEQGEPLDVALALFAKSPEAFRLAHGADRHLSWPAAADGLEEGALLRLKRALLAHRTWQVGQMLGYALSGALEDDLETWGKNEGGFREKWGNRLADFLRHSARQSDAIPEEWKDPSLGFEWPADLHYFEIDSRAETDSQPARAGLILVGVSVAQYDWTGWAHTLAHAFAHVTRLTREQIVGGLPNPRFGFQVAPFVCHAGMFPALLGEGDAGRGWRDWLKEAMGAIGDAGSDTQDENTGFPDEALTILARSPFWPPFVHARSSASLLEPLREVNFHLLGCDTLPLYEHLRIQIAAGAASRDFPEWALGQACERARLLSSLDLSLEPPVEVLSGVGQILGTLARLPHHHLKAFPITRKEVLPPGEAQAMKGLGETLSGLSERVKKGPWHEYATPLRRAARHIDRLLAIG